MERLSEQMVFTNIKTPKHTVRGKKPETIEKELKFLAFTQKGNFELWHMKLLEYKKSFKLVQRVYDHLLR